MENFIVEAIEDPNEAFNNDLLERIKAYNNQESPYHLAIRDPANRTQIQFRALADGEFIGGIGAEAYWQTLDIDNLFIAEAWRGSGVGTQLLLAAEKAGRAAGARFAHLKTFSYMAPEFYKKRGYRVVGELRDHPPGSSFLWFRKELG